MDVQLYIYDLSRGMASQFAPMLLGPGQTIEAIYHTSIVLDNVEYVYGQGIQTWSPPGSTHHGRPMRVLKLGTTSLPGDVVQEYLEGALRATYTAEAYDLFKHNCNNFSNDFAMFLVGSGIPQYILSQPDDVLRTPLGQMLRPQLDQSMRQVTQARGGQSVEARGRMQAQTQTQMRETNGHTIHGRASNGAAATQLEPGSAGKVWIATSLPQLRTLLSRASGSAALVFFTSSTCGPCKVLYGPYDALATEYPRLTLIKVDISYAPDVASAYAVHATPTFTSFVHGKQQDSFSGADATRLRSTVALLQQMAFPPHRHETLTLPTLLRWGRSTVSFTKCPPLEKLEGKLRRGNNGADGVDQRITAAMKFIYAREAGDLKAKDAPLPDMPSVAVGLVDAITTIPKDNLFAAYDLLRLLLRDRRASDWFASESATNSTVARLLEHVNSLEQPAPYSLRLVSLHLACNMFISNVFRKQLFTTTTTTANGQTGDAFDVAEPATNKGCSAEIAAAMITLLAECLLDTAHPTLRAAAASLAYNITTCLHMERRALHEFFPDDAPETRSREPASTPHNKSEGAVARFSTDLQTQLGAALTEALTNIADESDERAAVLKEAASAPKPKSRTPAPVPPTPPALPSADALRGIILALGRLVYLAPADGELLSTVEVMEGSKAVVRCKPVLVNVSNYEERVKDRMLADEVAKLLSPP